MAVPRRRYERSGTLHGLFRVRGFTQDDAHVFCLQEQLTDEILAVLNLTEEILTKFGFVDYEVMSEPPLTTSSISPMRPVALTMVMARR